MNTITFVLIMVVGGNTSQSGLTTIKAEFATAQACEAARMVLVAQMQTNYTTPIKAQGCFSVGSAK